MRKIFFLTPILLISQIIWAQPLQVKLKHTIIIDTDCAIDDMRAISLLLSRPEITIKAILLSDGSLSPNESTRKIGSLKTLMLRISQSHAEIFLMELILPGVSLTNR